MKQVICIVFIATLLISCSNGSIKDFVEAESNDLRFELVKLSNPTIAEKVDLFRTEVFSKDGSSSVFQNSFGVIFDFENLEAVYSDGEFTGTIVANQETSNGEQLTKYALGFYFNDDEEIVGTLMVKTEVVDSKTLVISYYDINGSKISNVTIDSESQTIKYEGNSLEKLNGSHGDDTLSCGNDVVECIEIMYTRLGWGSVSWWIGSALFAPGWTLGTVAGCTYAMCIQ